PSTLQAITPATTRGIRIGPRIRTLPSWHSQSHPLRQRRERFLPGADELDDDGGQDNWYSHFLYGRQPDQDGGPGRRTENGAQAKARRPIPVRQLPPAHRKEGQAEIAQASSSHRQFQPFTQWGDGT